MNRDAHDNLEDLARSLDARKQIFVDDKGLIHDAEKLAERDPRDHRPVTQLKPTTWFSEPRLNKCGELKDSSSRVASEIRDRRIVVVVTEGRDRAVLECSTAGNRHLKLLDKSGSVRVDVFARGGAQVHL